MKNLQEWFTKANNITLETNGNKIKQSQRNALKKDLMKAILLDIQETLGTENASFFDKGIALDVPNTELGDFVVGLDCTIKDIDTDFIYETEEYAREQNEKAQKKIEKEQEIERKREETRLARQKKLEKRA